MEINALLEVSENHEGEEEGEVEESEDVADGGGSEKEEFDQLLGQLPSLLDDQTIIECVLMLS